MTISWSPRSIAGFVEQVDGFRAVAVARTGTEALTAARELQPDLILLDVYLPDMTGLNVLQKFVLKATVWGSS